jgi:hypothetical protein
MNVQMQYSTFISQTLDSSFVFLAVPQISYICRVLPRPAASPLPRPAASPLPRPAATCDCVRLAAIVRDCPRPAASKGRHLL